MALSVEQVRDLEGARRWHALEARNVPLDHPGLVADPLNEVASLLTTEHRAERPLLFLATDDGVDVANALVELPMLENVENSTINLTVDAGHRRRGVGEQLARHLLDVARGEGRRRSISFVASPLDGGAPPAGVVLAHKLGAEPALEVIRRQLDVTAVDDAACDALVTAHVGDHAAGYDMVTWTDTVPDALVDDAARLMGRMTLDAPMGTVEWEEEVWDAARYREKEAEAMARGRRRFAAGAVERASGRLVAYTDVGVSTVEPAVSYQWDTIVDPEHRGHRLGLAVKIENLRRIRALSPSTVTLQTWNAAENAHMVAINDLVGFRPIERSTHFQLAL